MTLAISSSLSLGAVPYLALQACGCGAGTSFSPGWVASSGCAQGPCVVPVIEAAFLSSNRPSAVFGHTLMPVCLQRHLTGGSWKTGKYETIKCIFVESIFKSC